MNEKRNVPIDPNLLARARAMRHDPAPAEKKLWSLLRDRQLGGYKFRRQVPLGAFVSDFYCHELSLVVELDGESHLPRSCEDLVRTEILQRGGYRVVRFWNTDVFENMQGVLEAIYEKCERLAVKTPPHPSPLPKGEGDEIARAVMLLRAGRVVAFPTETVYGLGADATNASAVARIFAIKGRPSTNPLIVHVADESIARRYARVWPAAASRLVARYWPGPLTLVVSKAPSIVPEVTAGLDTVGLRAPNHPLALELLRAVDGPLAGPSANRSNHISPTTAQHVREELGNEVDLMLDGGPCAVGIESTVLSLADPDAPRILRPGAITSAMIEEVIEARVLQTHSVAEAAQPAQSPGQFAKHYAPRTPAYWFEPRDRMKIDPADAAILEINLDPEAYARSFYARLRMLDQQNLRAIYIELPPDTDAWRAIRDRILRAAVPFK